MQPGETLNFDSDTDGEAPMTLMKNEEFENRFRATLQQIATQEPDFPSRSFPGCWTHPPRNSFAQQPNSTCRIIHFELIPKQPFRRRKNGNVPSAYEDNPEWVVWHPAQCHKFHDECLSIWLNENPTCPMCRADLTKL